MNKFVQKLVYATYQNKLARTTIRPLYRFFLNLKNKKQKKSLHKYGVEMLDLIEKGSEKYGYTYWLDFGTLLGACREHDFISHDLDMDIAVPYKFHEIIRKAFADFGFQLMKRHSANKNSILTHNALEETYLYRGISMDVFYYHEDADTINCNSFTTVTDTSKQIETATSIIQKGVYVKSITLPKSDLQKIDFKGIRVTIPVLYKEYLSLHYGKNYMIPDAHFDYKKEAKNIRYYTIEEVSGEYEQFF